MEQYRWAVIILNTCFFCTKRNGSLLFYLSPLNTWIIISLRIRKYHCFPFFFRTQTYEFNLITRSSAILYFDRSKQFIEIQRQSLVSQTSRYHHYQIQMNYFHHYFDPANIRNKTTYFNYPSSSFLEECKNKS